MGLADRLRKLEHVAAEAAGPGYPAVVIVCSETSVEQPGPWAGGHANLHVNRADYEAGNYPRGPRPQVVLPGVEPGAVQAVRADDARAGEWDKRGHTLYLSAADFAARRVPAGVPVHPGAWWDDGAGAI